MPAEITVVNGETIIQVGESTALAVSAAAAAAQSALDATTAAQVLISDSGVYFLTPEDGVDPVTGVPDGRNFNVTQGGRLYLYRNDGGVPELLVEFATAGPFIQSGTGAVARTTQDKLREVVSVRDFGAVGDDVTDDKAAIQAAIDAVSTAGGGVVHLPAGNYKIFSGLSFSGSDVSIVGDGWGATKLICTFASGDILALGDGTANPNNCTISDLTITSTVPKTSGAAIVMRNAYNCKAERFRIDDNMYDGLVIDGGAGQFINHIDRFVINSGRRGIVLSRDGTLPQDVFISNGVVANCTDAGLYMRHCSGIYFTYVDFLTCNKGITSFPALGERVVAIFMSGVIADSTASHGWEITTNGGLVGEWILTNCWASSCGSVSSDAGMRIDEGSGTIDGISVSNASITWGQGYGVLLGPSENVYFSNPRIHCNSRAGSVDGFAVLSGVSKWGILGGAIGLGGIFTTNNQRYGIFINTGSSDNFSIIGVNLTGNTTGSLSDGSTGTNKTISGNAGCKTANQGTATIGAGLTTVSIAHGLVVTPAKEDIQITPVSDGPERYWVSATTSTTFTISLSGATGADRFFGWSARIKGA